MMDFHFLHDGQEVPHVVPPEVLKEGDKDRPWGEVVMVEVASKRMEAMGDDEGLLGLDALLQICRACGSYSHHHSPFCLDSTTSRWGENNFRSVLTWPDRTEYGA